jgi:hypothetical protein
MLAPAHVAHHRSATDPFPAGILSSAFCNLCEIPWKTLTCMHYHSSWIC